MADGSSKERTLLEIAKQYLESCGYDRKKASTKLQKTIADSKDHTLMAIKEFSDHLIREACAESNREGADSSDPEGGVADSVATPHMKRAPIGRDTGVGLRLLSGVYGVFTLPNGMLAGNALGEDWEDYYEHHDGKERAAARHKELKNLVFRFPGYRRDKPTPKSIPEREFEKMRASCYD